MKVKWYFTILIIFGFLVPMKLAIDFILVSSIVILLILLLVLYKHKKNVLPQKFLIALFSILVLLQFTSYGIFHQIRWLQFMALAFEGILMLIGPLIYLYVKSLDFKKKLTWSTYWYHLVPYLLYFLLLTLPILISAFQKKYIFEYLSTVNKYFYVRDCAELFFIAIYLIFSLRLFYKINTGLKNVFSILEYKNVKWLGHFITGLLVIIIFNFVILSFETFDKSSEMLDLINVFSFLLFIMYIGYYGISQSRIFIPEYLFKNVPNKNAAEKRSYIKEEELEDVENKLKSVFENEKLFLDESLTLHKLANALHTSDKKLSFYLNHHIQCT